MKPLLSVPVRFADIDSQHHSNHVAILAYVAEGRIRLLDDALRVAGTFDIDYVLVHIDADFLGEIYHPETVDVWGRIIEVGGKSVTSEYELRRGEKVLASAVCVNVFFNKATKKTTTIPEKLRRVMNDQSRT